MFKNPFSFDGRIRRLEYGPNPKMPVEVYDPFPDKDAIGPIDDVDRADSIRIEK